MGIVIRQSIKGTVVNYIGALIGIVTSAFVLPRLLSPDEVGLIRFLLALGILLASFCLLGTQQSMLKFAPYHKEHGSEKIFNGFNLLLLAFGSLAVLIGYIVFKQEILLFYKKSGTLIQTYYNEVWPIIVGQAIITFCEIYCMTRYRITIPAILREIVQRVLIIAIVILYYYQFMEQGGFVASYAYMYLFLAASVAIYTYRLGFRARLPKLQNMSVLKEQVKFSFFAYLIIAVINIQLIIDMLLIPKYADLSALGVYTTIVVIISVIQIPYRSMSSIVSPLIADAWHEGDMTKLNNLYKRSGLNTFIFGFWLYMLLAISATDILSFLPVKYQGTEFLVIVAGMGRLADLFFGLNGEVIEKSPLYKYNVVVTIVSLVCTTILNVIFLQLWGINGSALAMLVSLTAYNSARVILLKKNYNLFPITRITLLVAGLGLVLTGVFYYIHISDIVLLNIAVKSIIVTAVYGFCIYKFKWSEDFIHLAINMLKKLGLVKS